MHKNSIPQIMPMGEEAVLVTWGNVVDTALNQRVLVLDDRLTATRLAGVTDLVPAFASLLVVYDPGLISFSDVAHWIQEGIQALSGDEGQTRQGREHVVPTQYGGEAGADLEDLAAFYGADPRAIVRAHTSRAYQVAFLGFLPGFAYMGRVAGRIPVPRLATPRTRVPAGSVGLAGFQTGVYPFSSPGGWRIIGRTGLTIWDANDPIAPARFAPGDTVRFVESHHEPGPLPSSSLKHMPDRPALEVLQAGGIATLQDTGRPGYMHLGVGKGGTADTNAAGRANALVGNRAYAAVIEMALGGPSMRALRNMTFALDGADFQCHADGMPVPPRLSWFIRAGTTLRFAGPRARSAGGVRAFLAVSGGIDVPPVLGSRSTSLLAGFGGMHGMPLRSGDVIGLGDSSVIGAMTAGRYWTDLSVDISLKQLQLRFVPFSGLQAPSKSILREFQSAVWEVTDQSDRMGVRLRSAEGLHLPGAKRELASFGVVPGAIQLPPSGDPVVLGPDCQTTGGYPLLGVVIACDRRLLAQAVAGTAITFVPATMEEAYAEDRAEKLAFELGLRQLGR